MPTGYLFLCTNRTQEECLQRKLFGLSNKHAETVQKIKQGSVLFLYNMRSRALIGPFAAASDGKMNIEPRAWAHPNITGYPAQVRVQWEELHEIKDAARLFPFLRTFKNCELNQERTRALQYALKQAPVFTSPSEI